MTRKIIRLNQSVDKKIREGCEKMPPKKRKITVMILCFLFVVFFVFMLVDVFNSKGVKEMIKIEHITPLDLLQDTLTNHSQWLRY
jgi:hypothetical protein